jgi:hypothetical protein
LLYLPRHMVTQHVAFGRLLAGSAGSQPASCRRLHTLRRRQDGTRRRRGRALCVPVFLVRRRYERRPSRVCQVIICRPRRASTSLSHRSRSPSVGAAAARNRLAYVLESARRAATPERRAKNSVCVRVRLLPSAQQIRVGGSLSVIDGALCTTSSAITGSPRGQVVSGCRFNGFRTKRVINAFE